MEPQTLLMLFSAFFVWGFGANLFRISGGMGISAATNALGVMAFAGAHIMPFLVLKWWEGLLALVLFYTASALVQGAFFKFARGNTRWPENIRTLLRFGPLVMFFTSAFLSGMMLRRVLA